MAYAVASTTSLPAGSSGSLRAARAACLRPVARRHHRHLITARGGLRGGGPGAAAAAPVDMTVLDDRPVDRLPKNTTGPKTWAAMWSTLKARQVWESAVPLRLGQHNSGGFKGPRRGALRRVFGWGQRGRPT